jgi:hypothetical protein
LALQCGSIDEAAIALNGTDAAAEIDAVLEVEQVIAACSEDKTIAVRYEVADPPS